MGKGWLMYETKKDKTFVLFVSLTNYKETGKQRVSVLFTLKQNN